MVDKPCECCATHPCAPRIRIDPDAAQRTQVEHHAAVVSRDTELVVSSTLYRQQETVFGGKRDRQSYVHGTRGLDNRGRRHTRLGSGVTSQ
jgi:hypothetical protein